MADLRVTVEHGGKVYFGTVMRVKSTHLGGEDHGVFTAYLNCEARGSGVGLGGRSMDEYDKETEKRVGTAYGLDLIAQMISTVGVGSWEKIPGKDVIVLHEQISMLGSIPVGFCDITAERVLIFDEHWQRFRDEVNRGETDA